MALAKRGLAQPLSAPGAVDRTDDAPPEARLHRVPDLAPSMLAVHVEAVDEERRVAVLTMVAKTVEAALDVALDPVVVRTAIARRERMIVQNEGEGWVVLGALRTSPTPGVDAGEQYVIEARRIVVQAAHELALVTGQASLVLRAQGYIESLARDITTRASGAHKIIGRMLRLN